MEVITNKKNVLIVGAGQVGSLLSIYLAQRGYDVKIYEKRVDFRDPQNEKKALRSINLALSDRGIRALEEVGLLDEINKLIVPMKGRRIHNIDGTLSYQQYGKNGQAINSVSRDKLNNKLMDLAEAHGVKIIFKHKLLEINWSKNEVTFDRDGKNSVQKFDILFGADGANSQARLQLMKTHEKYNINQLYLDSDYKELNIPATKDGDFAMDYNSLHIWPRKNFMMIALPNVDKSFTATIFLPSKGENSFRNLTNKEQVKSFFEIFFQDVIPLIPNYLEEFFDNPVSSLITIKCYPWIRDDKFTLIGDSAHAMVPFYGQGMNCGFEDCRVLAELIDKHDHNWTNILEEYQILRVCDSNAIQELAMNNMIEMREKTADPNFLLQKKIEAKIHENHPTKWIPLYTLVTFSPNCRYSDAMSRGKFQEELMQEIMKIKGIEEKWENEEIQNLILIKLEQNDRNILGQQE